jgi:hypothetical protein
MKEINPVINYFNSQEQDPLVRAKLALLASRQYQKDWQIQGVNRVHLYYKDVEGDWLENWEEIDNNISNG